jgi:hypothetical protein
MKRYLAGSAILSQPAGIYQRAAALSMLKNLISPNEPWCFPKAPPHGPVADRNERWCFPETPPRIPATDPNEPWCFPKDAPRPRRRMRTADR